ncbi:unnamed protein product [Ilex paraguariensis]|uniref:Uncharacterized protein n=1 Tax=Ilex paraguariensis TaxID=185542 RepID=A0ABC8UE29_9AQUA
MRGEFPEDEIDRTLHTIAYSMEISMSHFINGSSLHFTGRSREHGKDAVIKRKCLQMGKMLSHLFTQKLFLGLAHIVIFVDLDTHNPRNKKKANRDFIRVRAADHNSPSVSAQEE